MNRLEKSGIFEIFLPNAELNQFYKFEIKTMQGTVLQKADPYGVYQERTTENASKTFDMSSFQWDDMIWMKNRKYKNVKENPMIVRNLLEEEVEKKDSILEKDFTHVLFNREERKRPTTFYTPSFCSGSPDIFRQYINEAHKRGIGVLMEISP